MDDWHTIWRLFKVFATYRQLVDIVLECNTVCVPVSVFMAVCESYINCMYVRPIVSLFFVSETGIIWGGACPMLSVWVAAGRGWGLHVLPGCGGLWLAVILLPSHVLFRAGAAQQAAAQHRQTGRGPAHEQGRAKLIPVREREEERLLGWQLSSMAVSFNDCNLLLLTLGHWMAKGRPALTYYIQYSKIQRFYCHMHKATM